MSGIPESERSDWTDVDLLTREEAHKRIMAEIADTRARLAEIGASDAAEREFLERRLEALRARAEEAPAG
jgi:hypothetical protein